MDLRVFKYVLIAAVFFMLGSCKQARNVPQGYYLLKENEVHYTSNVDSVDWDDDHEMIDEGDLEELIRPDDNRRFLGIKFKLAFYNGIDTARHQKQVVKKTEKTKKKQIKRDKKVMKKNEKRRQKAIKKGKTHYKLKEKKPKARRYGWRNWIRTHWGEPPIVMDTAKVSKTKQQMEVYLSKRGFKYPTISDTIEYDEKKRRATVHYYVESGQPYIINSISFDKSGRNSNLMANYNKMVKKEGTLINVGDQLDEDILDDERDHFTKYLKDHAFFGFTKSYVNFVVDTTIGDYKADIVVYIKEKQVTDPYNPGELKTIPHYVYHVDEVTYKLHNIDSLSFKDWEGYKRRVKELGLSTYYDENGRFLLLDTMYVIDTIINKHYLNLNSYRRKEYGCKVFGKCIDTLFSYKGYIIYNEQPFLKPTMLNKQNFLEHSFPERKQYHYAKDYYVDRTYKSFSRLGIFSRVVADLHVDPDRPFGNVCDVVYDLTPTPKQQFTVEPRATNTASILGISGKFSYVNKNINRGANRLTISLEGGMQSQPLVQNTSTDEKIFSFRGLNTFEIGPEITYKIPRFYPMTKKMMENVSKRSFPSTEISALYNFQIRPEFDRHVAELSYQWQFSIPPDEIQQFTVTPVKLNYVLINKKGNFDNLLQATNDPFLINSYANFFQVGLMNIKHEYNNQRLKKSKRKFKKDHAVSNTVSLSAAGLVVNTVEALIDNSQSFVDAFNQKGKTWIGVQFAQFAKIEETFIFNQYVNKKHRVAYRINIGVGYPYGNGISLPYAESFVGGGSNDIRAWDAQTMPPGSTQRWKSPNYTETQIADMKLMMNLEWRFKFSGRWEGALFADAGNIWKLQSEFSTDPGLFYFDRFINQVAIGVGAGIRYNLGFLIGRLDVSWPLHNPYLPAGARWWLRNYAGKAPFIDSPWVGKYPHAPNFQLGIGYPF